MGKRVGGDVYSGLADPDNGTAWRVGVGGDSTSGRSYNTIPRTKTSGE